MPTVLKDTNALLGRLGKLFHDLTEDAGFVSLSAQAPLHSLTQPVRRIGGVRNQFLRLPLQFG